MWFIQTQAWTALPMTITSRGLNSIDWGIVSAANGAVAEMRIARVIGSAVSTMKPDNIRGSNWYYPGVIGFGGIGS